MKKFIKEYWLEFTVTVFFGVVGLIVGKMISRQLDIHGVPIASGDPIPVPLATSVDIAKAVN